MKVIRSKEKIRILLKKSQRRLEIYIYTQLHIFSANEKYSFKDCILELANIFISNKVVEHK